MPDVTMVVVASGVSGLTVVAARRKLKTPANAIANPTMAIIRANAERHGKVFVFPCDKQGDAETIQGLPEAVGRDAAKQLAVDVFRFSPLTADLGAITPFCGMTGPGLLVRFMLWLGGRDSRHLLDLI